ncbi:MAG: nucleotidyltransferase domain-containing protein [Treponema sp.]|jgi:predicted nucleotidyltransferase|nr:nucleotidyltransferase domain-containing protein [Treponema sp.]
MYENMPEIRRLVTFITSKITPEKIILFGSYARGDNKDNSDIDLLIIMRDLKNEREVTGLLYKSLLTENITIPIDLIAIDFEKYNKLKNKNGYIYKTIEREGKVVYE